MKKTLFTIATLVALGLSTNAQKTKWGVRAGVDMISTTITVAETVVPGYGTVPGSGGTYSGNTTGFHIGGFAEFDVADKIALQPGVSFISANGGSIYNFPLLAKYKVGDKFGIVAGPSIYMWSATTPDGSESKTLIDITAGGNYDITENIFAEAHYSLGLGGDYKIGNFMIGAGYKF